jgi:hypothetical protein
MAKVAVDIDDTLYSFNNLVRDVFFHLALERDDKSILSAAYSRNTQWRTLYDMAGGDLLQEAIAIAHRPDVMKQTQPFPGASDTCRAIAEKHDIVYISTRDPEATDATDAWLFEHNFPKGELKCQWEDKIPLIADCQYIIDDRPSTLIRFVYDRDWDGAGFTSPLSGQSWGGAERKGFAIVGTHNENLTDVPNLYLAPSWAGLNYYLSEKGVLDEPAYEPLSLGETVNA